MPLRRARFLPSALAVLATVGALVVVPAGLSADAAQDPAGCATPVSIANGGFEDPNIGGATYQIMNADLVPGWSTTAPDNQIEIWRDMGVTPDSGSQFAELNANQVSTLYQDVATVPGQVLVWSLAHRGRTGVDVMRVKIGAPAGTLVTQGADIADGTEAWGHYEGSYRVPAGQTVTRFAFESVSSANGIGSYGNFLDSVVFSTPACLVTTDAVTGATGPSGQALIGDVLTYTATTTNGGQTPALVSSLSSILPAGLALVPGSIQVDGVSRTDAIGDDTAAWNAGTSTVTAQIGSGASTSGGTLAPGATAVLRFSATVTASGIPTINATATADYTDPATTVALTSVSNTVSVTVRPEADLAVTQTGPANPAAGAIASYPITVTDLGPFPGTGVVLTSTLPALENLTVDSPACTITGTNLACALGTIASGGATTVTVSGRVPASSGVGVSFPLASSVTGTAVDPASANNSASMTSTSTTSADLRIEKVASVSSAVQSETVGYTVTVHNDGPSPADAIVVRDTAASGLSLASPTLSQGTFASGLWQVGTLASGASATMTVSGTLVTSGSLANTATVISSSVVTDPDHANDAATATVQSVPADRRIAITPVATVADATHQGGVTVGDTITYQYTVTDTGNLPVTGIVVTDSTGLSVSCPATTLAVGASMVCTAAGDHRVSQAEFDAGTAIARTASVTGTATGHGVAAGPAPVSVPVAPAHPALSQQATADFGDTDGDGAIDAGEHLSWVIAVRNTGDVTLTDLVVGDTVGSSVACTVTSLAPGESTVCTTDSYRLTSTDAAAGQKVNLINARAQSSRDGGTVLADAETITVPAAPLPRLAITVRGVVTPRSHQDAAQPGDTVSWHYDVTNTGNVPVDALAVVDARGIDIECDVTVLAPGESTECIDQAEQTVTEDDIIDPPSSGPTSRSAAAPTGALSRIATAAGRDVVAGADVVSDPANAMVPTAGALSTLRIVATTTAPGSLTAVTGAVLGDHLSRYYTLTNTGTVTLSTLSVSDPAFGGVTCPATSLTPGASMTCHANGVHVVTKAEVAGHVLGSTVTARGTSPARVGGAEVVSTQLVTLALTSAPTAHLASTGTSHLASTGTDIAPVLGAALGLIAFGMLLLGRRRRRAQD